LKDSGNQAIERNGNVNQKDEEKFKTNFVFLSNAKPKQLKKEKATE